MTTTFNYGLLASCLSRLTGVTWRAVEHPDVYCFGASAVFIRPDDCSIRIIFDPPHENFSVGIEYSDTWLATGHDIETLLERDYVLRDLLRGTTQPWQECTSEKMPRPDLLPVPKRQLFTLSFFGCFTLKFCA